ncbi:MAG: DUF1080 domain-containing protein [Verrucomicrobia bacterium]|nr:MAG: DUF1080 domain-containing protein [Verrucomicrobiota bacterium]
MKNTTLRSLLVAGAFVGGIVAGAAAEKAPPIGYTDTPFLPGGQWRVHDLNRPRPQAVQSGPFQTEAPPADAIVLFDGKDLAHWVSTKTGAPAPWKVVDGCLEVAPKKGDIVTKEKFGSFKLHLEWREPADITGTSQMRGNSGVFLMNRYEIQVLECFKNTTYADGMAGAIYGQTPPLVNPCRPPGEWQTYDITFEAPVFKEGKVAKPAYVTILFNGVLVQDHTEILGTTQHKKVAAYEPHDAELPLKLQDHNNPVRFRNIWIQPLKTPAVP